MQEEVYLESVFKISGIPTYTFVEPKEYNQLLVSVRTPGRGVVIEGPSGIGKTTCVLNIIKKLPNGAEYTVLSGRKASDKKRIDELITSENFGNVIIDDFHKLDSHVKETLSNVLKTHADEERDDSKIIIIGINKTGKSLIEYSSDLRNRISIVKFESNNKEKILELIKKGEKALNIEIAVKDEIANDSHGAFHIAQMLAHNACVQSGILEKKEEKQVTTPSYHSLKENVMNDLELSFSDLVTKFVQGQRVKKGSRAPYLHVLYWLSKTDEWSINLEASLIHYPKHRNSVGQILKKGHLYSHYCKDERFSDVIYFNEDTTEISIEDPKFLFYIRNLLWTKLAEKIGFYSFDFTSPYDFALSFSGSKRDDAEYIYNKLSESEISVFYDFNEQSRILSEDVEDYLAPIYRSESVYVIPLLSNDYPNRVWCKFEGDIFRSRFGKNSIIPLRYSDCSVGMFDATNGVGGFSLDVSKPIESQLDIFIGLLINKIHERRIELNNSEQGLEE
ncbi:TIR domain-containing protein [Erwinia tasmaniensis]|uniref:TIR domain-containing protein n=1 Tax=Erwinia tasmaniensis TaxID=338565 RepID=UPI003A4D7B0A